MKKKSFREKIMSGVKMVLGFFFAVVFAAAVAIAALFVWKKRRGENKENQVDTRRPEVSDQRERGGKNDHTVSETGRKGVKTRETETGRESGKQMEPENRGRKQCWELYRLLYHEQKMNARIKDFFCGDVFLYYVASLLGVMRYDLKKSGWDGIEDRVSYCINDAIGYRFRQLGFRGNGLMLSDMEYIGPDQSEEQYYRARQLNEEEGERTEEEYRVLEEQLKRCRNNKNTRFYREMWERCSGLIPELLACGEEIARRRNEGGGEKEKGEISARLEKVLADIRSTLELAGVLFIFGEEAEGQEKNYLSYTDDGEYFPAVIRKSDGYVYYTGQADKAYE